MPSEKFLSSVAEHHLSGGINPAGVVFVVPNKRAAMFLRIYFKRLVKGRTMVMPRFLPLSSFVASLSPLTEASRTELLFVLYRCYRRVMAGITDEENIRSFDDFVFWGDLILSDFNDLDANAVDASMLFSNLERLRSIESNYLSSGQADAIEHLWGYRPPSSEDVERFWKEVISLARLEDDGSDPENPKPELSLSFVNLWMILDKLYVEFKNELRSRGLAYSGMIVADAAERLRKASVDEFDFTHCVFAGIGSTTANVRHIFRRLKTLGVATFYWDLPLIFDKLSADGHNGSRMAMRNVGRLAKEFPMPADYQLPRDNAAPVIDIVGVPSNMMQAQMAGDVLRQWNAPEGKDPLKAYLDNTAVLVPDTTLLPSLLAALPESPGGINVTMGLPVRETPFATIMRAIVQMHNRSRLTRGELTFFHEDISEVASNPSIRRVSPDGCRAILEYLEKNRIYTAKADELKELAPDLAFVFDMPLADSDASAIKDYLDRLIRGLAASFISDYDAQDDSKNRQQKVLDYYKGAIEEIFAMSSTYGVGLGRLTYFKLVERIVSTSTLNLSGTPLKGLQVMGVLESRALDFDNLIVMSMNERIMPRKNPLKTLVPHILRRAYGMSTIDDIESDNAYNFFRLLSRARRVALLYDSRVSGVSAGEISRYLLQIDLMLHGKTVFHSQCSLRATPGSERTIKVEKTPEVIALLDRYRAPEEGVPAPEKPKRVSASMLKSYLACPLRFYFKYVRDLSDEGDDPSMFMDAKTLGDIVHLTLENLYKPFVGKTVDKATLQNMLDSDIKGYLARAINEKYYHGRYDVNLDAMPGEARSLGGVMEKIVRRALEIDRDYAPFVFVGAEQGPTGPWEMAPGLKLNFVSKIDRIDRFPDGTLRFIDYKTGGDNNYVASCEALFGQDYQKRNDAMFQLLLYCHAAKELDGVKVDIRPEIYRLRKVYVDSETKVKIGSEKSKDYVFSFNDENVADFREHLTKLMSRIFDPTVAFEQTSDRENCTYCVFSQLCGRNVDPK